MAENTSSELDQARLAYVSLLERERLLPTDTTVKADLALTLKTLGDPLRAEEKLREAVALDPRAARAAHVLGYVLRERGALEEAVGHFLRSREPGSEFPDPFHLLVFSLHALGRHGEIFALGIPNEPGQRFGEIVMRAIVAWQSRDFAACGEWLEKAREIRAALSPKLPNASVFEAYRHDVERLLQTRAEGSHADPAMPPLYVIGDSHSLTPAHLPVPFDGETRRLEPHLVIGCKAWHLVSRKPNPYAAAFDATVLRIPEGSSVMACFGELDCRHSVGIFRHVKRQGIEDPLPVVQSLTAGYVARLADVANVRRLRLLLVTPPTSNIRDALLTAADRRLFRSIESMFCDGLREQAAAHGLRVVDLAAMTRNANGSVRRDVYVRTNHVLPDVFLEACAEAKL